MVALTLLEKLTGVAQAREVDNTRLLQWGNQVHGRSHQLGPSFFG